ALHVVNSVEDATREWALSNNQFMFNFEHVCFSECDTEDNFACVSKCDSSEKSIVTNYNPGPKDMHIESYIDEEEFTWSDDGSNILIDWDPTVFSIESRLLKVGDDKWAHMKTNGEISVVEDRKSATSGWYIDPSKKIKFNDRSGTNWNFYTCQDDENALVSKVYMGTSLQNGCAKMTGVVGKDIPTLPDATLNAGPFVITVGDAEEAEDLMRLSVDESRVTVSLDTQEFAVFELDNGYLKVRDEKWIKVNKDSSLLEVVDSEEDATEGWAIIEGKLYLDRKRGMKVNYSRVELSGCEEDADEQVVVYLGIRKGCARFKNVVIEEYTEPTPTPTPSETPVETEIETEPEYVEEITTNDEDFDDITTEGELVEEITTEGELIEEITTEGDGGGVDETTTPEPEITTPEVDPTPTDNEEASIIEEEETNTTGDGDEDVISTENEGGEETTTAEEPETTTAEEPETTTPEAETETAEVESTTVEEEETTTTGDGDDDVISTDNEDDENSTVNEEATTIEEEETTTTDDDDEDVTPTGEDDDDNPTGEDGDEETTTTDDGDVNVTPTGEDGDADATPTDEEEEATTIDDEEVATDEEEEEEEVTPNDGNQSSSTNDNQSSTIEISTETDEETAEYVSDVSSSISMETSTSVAPTIDPSGPIMIKVIHEEEKWFSMVSSNIGVSDVQSASLFRVEDGYLIIDDSHYIKVESNGLLVAVDHKNETSPEWTLIDGVLYYDFHEHVNFFSILQEAVFSACDKDGNTLVFVGSKAECDSLSVVVVEGVTTPDSTIDPNDPANNVPDSTNDPSEPTDDESDPTDDESESINDESDSTNYVSGSINDESDSTNYASDSTNYSSDPTGEVSDSTNEVSDSTDEASDPTDDPSDSTSDQSECTGEPSESTNDSSESINEPSDSTNNQPDSTNEPFESAYSVENMTEDPKESGGWNSLTDSLEESEAPEGSKTENISEASQDTENETNVSSSEVKSSSGHISNTSSTKFNNSATDDITSATNYSTNIVDQSTVISDENTSDNPTTIANQSVVVSEDKKSNSGVNTYITETICDASAGCTEIVKSAEVVYVTTTDEIIVTETKCENVSECHIVTTVKTSSYSTIAYTTYLPVVVESDKESVVVETEIENHDMFMDTITTMITCIGTVCEHSVTNVNEELEAMSDMALDVAEENASSALQNENPVINSSLEMINVGDTVRSFSMISSTSMLAVLFLLVFV
ncbi:Putative 2'-O-methyl transferase, partial [Candida maltosa Xu316]